MRWETNCLPVSRALNGEIRLEEILACILTFDAEEHIMKVRFKMDVSDKKGGGSNVEEKESL